MTSFADSTRNQTSGLKTRAWLLVGSRDFNLVSPNCHVSNDPNFVRSCSSYGRNRLDTVFEQNFIIMPRFCGGEHFMDGMDKFHSHRPLLKSVDDFDANHTLVGVSY